ncbi:hypothetical protein CPB85DRAFT_1262480 [Mucidula mucida]|nr:hypothetical protein CPB85DRAFT_1262480 [Mucidula mucida]
MTAESYRSSKATTKTLLLNYLTALPVPVTLKSLMLLAAQPTWTLHVFSFLTSKDNEARLSQGVQTVQRINSGDVDANDELDGILAYGSALGSLRLHGCWLTFKPANSKTFTSGSTAQAIRFCASTTPHLGSRCAPNALPEWEMSSFTMNLTAVRDIHCQAGEEITATSYVDRYTLYADRVDQLRSGYDMAGTCTACQQPAESDQRRQRVTKLRHIVAQFPSWHDTPAGAQLDTMIRSSVELMHNIELEGLQSDTELYLCATMQVYNAYLPWGTWRRRTSIRDKSLWRASCAAWERSSSTCLRRGRAWKCWLKSRKGKHLVEEVRELRTS